MRFTPGPWVAHFDYRADEWTIRLPRVKSAAGQVFICEVAGHYDQMEPNARLIAAAPELYEALCAALLDLNRLDSETQVEVESAGGKHSGLRSLRMAEAALAKVDGER